VYISNYRRKVDAVFFFFLFFLLFCLARLFFIQLFSSNYLAEMAKKQHSLFLELEPVRGGIYDCNLKAQAINIAMNSLYASANEILPKDKEAVINKLAPILNLSHTYLKDRIYRKKSFVWIARKIAPDQSEQIKNLRIRGLGFLRETKRIYPNGYLASQIIGFAGIDNAGLEGIEMTSDKYLRGEAGWAVFLRDARQKKLEIWEKMIPPKDGYDMILTIDEVIQYIAERELDKAYTKHHAKGATIIVMNPYTGAILALANRPTFDLNEHSQVSKDRIRDRGLCDLFEPGSVFKIVTAAAAFEEKKVTETDRFFCENGRYKVGPHILHDHEPEGWLSFREVIEKSSNIGTVKAAQILGPDTLYKYIKLFGFGAKSGIDLPGEISGLIREPKAWSKISIAAVPIGQEVGVTAIQLVTAMSVIANGGQLMKPYVISEIKDKYGEMIKVFSPQVRNRVVSAETAARLRKILAGVVAEGTGRLAKIEGFSAAGKTGTAQKLEPNGTYSHSKFVGSFVGFAPAEDPLIAVAVVMDEPHPAYYGGVVAAPVFKNVANDVIRYIRSTQKVIKPKVADEDKKAS